MWQFSDVGMLLIIGAVIWWWYSYITFVLRYTRTLGARIAKIFLPFLLLIDSFWPSGTWVERVKLVIAFIVLSIGVNLIAEDV